MPHAEINGSKIIVTAGFHQRDIMAQMPGARHHGSNTWHIPLTWAACITLRGLFSQELEIGPGLKAWGWETLRNRIQPALALRDAMELPPGSAEEALNLIESGVEPGGSGFHLNPYQRADAAFLATARQALLANEPGLGKSGAAIRAVQLLEALEEGPLPVCVICPNSLKLTVWKQELAMWAPEYTVTVVDGPASQRRKQLEEKSDFKIINWEAVRLHSRLAKYGMVALTDNDRTPKELNKLEFRTVIMDEAHRLAHPRDSKQCRAAWAVAHGAEFRFALTGTPVADNAGDFWGILHGLMPDSFPAKTKYLDRYATVTLNLWGGAEVTGLDPGHEAEFRQITNPVWRRIPKKAALPFLPEKLPTQFRMTPMTPAQTRLYRKMEEEMLVQLDDGQVLAAPGQLAVLTRLTQFAAACAKIDESGEVQLATPSCKVNDLADLLEEMGEEPLVVAAVSRKLIELASVKLRELNITHGLITGAQDINERARTVTAFQSGELRCVLLTLGAGSEGITLTRASTILFMQSSWRPLENEQAEGRIHRIGSEGHSCIRVLEQITPGTVEEGKLRALKDKGYRIEEIIKDKDALHKLLGK
jgi:SNF2 family DNA or RNA helicase